MYEQTKTDKVIEKLKTKQGLTIRDMVSPPFYLNAPNGIIRNIKKRGYSVLDEWVEKKQLVNIGGRFDIKVVNRYKRFWIEV